MLMDKKDILVKVILAFVVVAGIVYFIINKNNSVNTNQEVNLTEVSSKNIDVNKIEKKLKEVTGKDLKIDLKGETKLYSVEVKSGNTTDKLLMDAEGNKFYAPVLDIEQIEKQKKEAEASAKVSDSNKSDKPKVELFVMSYCPYGTQTEKGILPVLNKLGDKIDAKIRFVNYAMHPSKGEVQENLLQYCVQKEEPAKFNSYLGCFLEKGDSDGCLKRVGINKKDLKQCLDDTDKKYQITKNLKDKKSWLNGYFPRFLIDDELNKKYGVQGSPTLIVNGQKVETGRDSQSLLNAICSGFKNPPKECKEKMSTETPAPGFGYDNKGNQNQAQGGCGA